MKEVKYRKLLKEYKKNILKESNSSLIKMLVSDSIQMIDLWLEVDLEELMSSDDRTKYEFINDSLDNYIEDVYDDIEGELGDSTTVDKWLKKNRKRIISLIIKELNK